MQASFSNHRKALRRVYSIGIVLSLLIVISLILISLKLDGTVTGSWAVVLIPVYLLDLAAAWFLSALRLLNAIVSPVSSSYVGRLAVFHVVAHIANRFLSSNSAYFACLLLSLLLFVAFQITLIGNLDGAWDLSAMSVAIPLYASNAALLLAMAIAFGKDYYYSNRSIPLCC